MIRPACTVLFLAVMASGCAAPPPQSHASAAQMTACRQRADDVYLRQNRTALYDADRYATSTRDSPFGAAGLPGNASSGLSDRFERDNLMSDCLRGTGAGADTTATPVGASAPAPITNPIPASMKALPPPPPAKP